MKKEEIIKELCKIMDVKYSHFDEFKKFKAGLDYFDPIHVNSEPLIVVYSGMSPWRFAILEDMSVITIKTLMFSDIIDFYDNLKKDTQIYKIKEEINKAKEAEKFIKDNNYNIILKN